MKKAFRLTMRPIQPRQHCSYRFVSSRQETWTESALWLCVCVCLCVHMLLELRESCGVEECEFLSSRQQVRVRTECSSDRTDKRFADVCPFYQHERRCRRFLRDGVAAAHPAGGSHQRLRTFTSLRKRVDVSTPS